MALRWITRTLVAAFWLVTSTGVATDLGAPETSNPVGTLSPDEQALVDFAAERFEAQGLTLPDVEFVFHDGLMPCGGHLGIHRPGPVPTIEMCSMDKRTMLHELAHTWARANLSEAAEGAFVEWRGLDSWNDHRHEWARRGTEHVAEAIAWALLDEPNHVKWVEVLEDGTRQVSYRILTLGVTVEVLYENFTRITGTVPVFRDLAEDTAAESTEASRAPCTLGELQHRSRGLTPLSGSCRSPDQLGTDGRNSIDSTIAVASSTRLSYVPSS